MSDENWEDVGYIRASSYREPILRTLAKSQPLTPSEIAEKSSLDVRTVSVYLTGDNGLKNKGLVKCLNETAKKGRLYVLTSSGQAVLQSLDNVLN